MPNLTKISISTNLMEHMSTMLVAMVKLGNLILMILMAMGLNIILRIAVRLFLESIASLCISIGGMVVVSAMSEPLSLLEVNSLSKICSSLRKNNKFKLVKFMSLLHPVEDLSIKFRGFDFHVFDFSIHS